MVNAVSRVNQRNYQLFRPVEVWPAFKAVAELHSNHSPTRLPDIAS